MHREDKVERTVVFSCDVIVLYFIVIMAHFLFLVHGVMNTSFLKPLCSLTSHLYRK